MNYTKDDDIKLLIVKQHRKSISIKIRNSSLIEVHAPFGIEDKDIDAFVEKHGDWINAKLAEMKEAESALNSIDVASKAEFDEKIELAKKIIPEKCAYYADMIGVDYGRITLKAQKTLFGSCSAAGNLNFNIALMFAPERVLDYVIIHELCHLKEMNHSVDFWHEVEKVMKDYKVERQWLNDNGAMIMRKAGII
ncbi:MAG: SprT family zinc-dependent metalloprotease [Catonella sp.]|nr:SprT family zinc-dependent metalloprotease [Catonella sp.]MDY6356578.1 SprT family zinc-dependent metalloprotease [Catonella sp.]